MFKASFLAAAFLLASAPAPAQQPERALIEKQRAAIAKFNLMDGLWRGEATVLGAGGKHRMVQTERVGSFLGGTLKLIEGRGYGPNGRLDFNAFAIISWDEAQQAYSFRSHAQGQAGTFPIRLTDKGYIWEISAGPATIRYTAVFEGDTWHETGERLVAGQAPQRIFEMKLKRFAATDWPAAGAAADK